MKTIAIAGKGGTGKSTLSAITVRWLSDHVSKSILVVDADSNVNLNDLLGVDLKETVGGIREEMKDKVHSLPGGMSKQQFLEYKIQSSIVETPDFDLIAMELDFQGEITVGKFVDIERPTLQDSMSQRYREVLQQRQGGA